MKILKITLFPILLSYLITFTANGLLLGKTTDVITDRMRFMQMAERSIFAIKQSIMVLDFRRANDHALMIQKWAYKMKYFFPPGSGASVSNLSAASNDIWKNLTVFNKFIKLKQEGADRMVIAARDQNKEQLKAALDATVESCNLCHDAFRN